MNKELSGTEFAQFVEVNPRLKIHLTQNAHIAASGMFLWINGNAETGDYYRSVTDSDDRRIITDETFFYGGALGLVMRLGDGAS